MPYFAKGKCVYKKDTGKKVGCTDGSVKDYMAALHANVKESFDQAVNRILSEFTNTGGPAGATTTAPLGLSSQTPQQQQPVKNLNDPAHLQQVCSSVDVNDPQHLQQACAQFGIDPNNPQQSQQVEAVKKGIATYNKRPQATPAQQQQKLTQPLNTGAKAPVSAPPNVNNPVTQPTQQI